MTGGFAALPASVHAAVAFGATKARASASLVTPGLIAQQQPVVPLCGVTSPQGSSGRGLITPVVYAPSTTPSPTTIVSSNGIEDFYFDASNGEIYSKTNNSIMVTSASGRVLSSFSIPNVSVRGSSLVESNANDSLIADPSGDIYFFMLAGSSFDLVKLSPSGAQLWDYPVKGVPNGLFAWHDGSGAFAAAVVIRQPGTSVLVSAAGTQATGTEPVPGTGNYEYVTPTASGGIVYSTGNYVYVLGASGSPVASSSSTVPYFGATGGTTSAAQVPGAAFSFYQGGDAVEVGSTIYVADDGPSDYGHGIDLFSTAGIYEGDASTTAVGGLSAASSMYYDQGDQSLIYQVNGGIATLSLSSVQDLVAVPAAATQNGFGDTLGIGAGLTTNVTAGYFPAGSTPGVTASFDPWWQNYTDPLELSYTVGSGPQVRWRRVPSATVVALSWSGVASGAPLQFPLSVPSVPGTYLVNADLIDTVSGVTIGSTCLTYSVGMAGDTLNLAGLAPGVSYGGPGPERGVQLASELGTDDMREQLVLSTLLPSCNASAPNPSACGPGALTNWGAYDPAIEQAAVQAKSLGVSFEVQFGLEDPVDEAIVSAGYFGEDALAILAHFHTTAPDLTYVEAWNEPNSGPYTPANYVDNILKPFYEAVQQANAADGTNLEVIGGTVVGLEMPYWTGIAQAGGFSYMNIASIHAYPGFDRSFEEEGTPAAIGQLKSLMASYGVGSMPIWDTEQGWWSDGEEDFYDVGNWAPREWMWLRSLGITNWAYFGIEGQFNGYGVDFSLIEANNADYFVKPGAIGLMTVNTLLGDRPFIKQVELGIPHAYGMLFGPPANGSSTSDILAVWTDDLDVPGDVSLTSGASSATIATTGSLGQPGSLNLNAGSPTEIWLSGAPTYLSVPAGETITVGPSETFGPNLALASTGATATASSSLSQENNPTDVILGTATALNGNGMDSTPAWASAQGDTAPWVEVTLPSAQSVDRVIVATSSTSSIAPGLRNYTIELDENGQWTDVDDRTSEYFNRIEWVEFPTANGVTAVKVIPTALDYNSQDGGLPPYWWTPTFPDYPIIYSVELYGPGVVTTPGVPTSIGP